LDIVIPDALAFSCRRVCRRRVTEGMESQWWNGVIKCASKRLGRDLSRGDLERIWRLKVPLTAAALDFARGGNRPRGMPRDCSPSDLRDVWLLSGALASDLDPIRPPPRYRHRNNRKVHVSCDADAFLGALIRGWSDPEIEPF